MARDIRVLWDGGAFGEALGGVSRYYCEVLKRIGGFGVECQHPMVGTRNVYLQAMGVPGMQGNVHDFVKRFCGGWYFPGVSYVYRMLATVLPRLVKCGERANDRALDAMIGSGDFDVYHVTAPNYYDSRWKRIVGRKPIVVTVHDLVFDVFRKDRRVIRGRRELFAAASAIIAVSEFTKSEIVRFYGVNPSRITVVYHGCDGVKGGVSKRGGYILFVGRRDGYKNFAWMENAIRPVLEETGLRLLTTDGKYTDEELAALYRGASAFVYPSRCEGFGIPILEAMSNGCPVLCSDIPVFHEVAGDAAQYFRLDDEDDFREKLRKTIDSGELVEKGFERLKSFGWEKCASETAAVYRRVANA